MDTSRNPEIMKHIVFLSFPSWNRKVIRPKWSRKILRSFWAILFIIVYNRDGPQTPLDPKSAFVRWCSGIFYRKPFFPAIALIGPKHIGISERSLVWQVVFSCFCYGFLGGDARSARSGAIQTQVVMFGVAPKKLRCCSEFLEHSWYIRLANSIDKTKVKKSLWKQECQTHVSLVDWLHLFGTLFSNL